MIEEKTEVPNPRTLSDLRSFLHGYRIKSGGEFSALGYRATTIINNIDFEVRTPAGMRAARELAELDPSLSWLPGWKPRERIQAVRKGEG